MTKEKTVEFGIESENAKAYFYILGHENIQTDPAKRANQIARYERARADMHEAMNRHHAALEELGML